MNPSFGSQVTKGHTRLEEAVGSFFEVQFSTLVHTPVDNAYDGSLICGQHGE